MWTFELNGKTYTSDKTPNQHQISVLGSWMRRGYGYELAAGGMTKQVRDPDHDEIALVGAAVVGLLWPDIPLSCPGFYRVTSARVFAAGVLEELLDRGLAQYLDFIAAARLAFELEKTLITQTEVDDAANPS